MSLADIINKFETGDFGSKPITNKGLGKSKFKDRISFWNGIKLKKTESSYPSKLVDNNNTDDNDTDDNDVLFKKNLSNWKKLESITGENIKSRIEKSKSCSPINSDEKERRKERKRKKKKEKKIKEEIERKKEHSSSSKSQSDTSSAIQRKKDKKKKNKEKISTRTIEETSNKKNKDKKNKTKHKKIIT
jgi:hypothetical protein